MIFLRAKSNAGNIDGTANSRTALVPIPVNVRVGDFCLLKIITSDYNTSVSVPAWLSSGGASLAAGTLDGVKFFTVSGFVTSGLPGTNIAVTNSGGTTANRAWALSASFWGGVNATTPFAYANAFKSASHDPSISTSITSLKAKDSFVQSVGARSYNSILTGTTAQIGFSAWTAPAGAAPDYFFGYNGANQVLRRDMTASDSTLFTVAGSAIKGRLAILPTTASPSTAAAAQTVNASFQSNAGGTSDSPSYIDFTRAGLVTRYVDTSNYVIAYFFSSAGLPHQLRIIKYVGGTGTLIGSLDYAWEGQAKNNLKISVDAAGVCQLFVNDSLAITTTADSDLATSGALAKGWPGIFVGIDGTPYAAFEQYISNFWANSSNATAVALGSADMIVVDAASGNASTMSILGTPSLTYIDEISYGPVDSAGRSITTAYGSMSGGDFSVEAQPNDGSVNYMFLSYFGLNAAVTALSKGAARLPVTNQNGGWRFYLANADGSSRLAEIVGASARKLQWILNRPGSCSFSLPLDNVISPSLEVLNKSILAYRDGDCAWGGPIWTLDEDTTNDTVSVTAAEWLKLLDRRLLAPAQERFARFGTIDAGSIAAHLISLANQHGVDVVTDPANGSLAASYGLVPIWVGTVERTQDRARSYERFQSLGQEISALSEIESGYDIYVNPLTLEMSIYNRLDEDLSATVVFGYRTVPHNLLSVNRQRAADNVVNGMYVVGKTSQATPPEQIESDSLIAYGFQEESVQLSDVTDPLVAAAYAAGEFVYRSNPTPVYSIKPVPVGAAVPRPLSDYHIGSIVAFSADRGPIQVTSQKSRVFELSISIDEEGNETVESLSTTAAS